MQLRIGVEPAVDRIDRDGIQQCDVFRCRRAGWRCDQQQQFGERSGWLGWARGEHALRFMYDDMRNQGPTRVCGFRFCRVHGRLRESGSGGALVHGGD